MRPKLRGQLAYEIEIDRVVKDKAHALDTVLVLSKTPPDPRGEPFWTVLFGDYSTSDHVENIGYYWRADQLPVMLEALDAGLIETTLRQLDPDKVWQVWAQGVLPDLQRILKATE